MRIPAAGFVPPCLPTKAQQPPSGPLWWHEIKHDGFRGIARKDGAVKELFVPRTPHPPMHGLCGNARGRDGCVR
jgi:hypothetical protein